MLPAEAELLLMIKGPLVTQVEKSSSDPRWKRNRKGKKVSWQHFANFYSGAMKTRIKSGRETKMGGESKGKAWYSTQPYI